MKNNNNRVDGQYAENLIEREKADAEKKWKEFEKFKKRKRSGIRKGSCPRPRRAGRQR